MTWIARSGYRKVRRDISRADPVPETALHQRRAARDRALQEPLNLSVVHKRRDAHHKAAPGGPFLGRTFDGVPQKARDRVAKTSVARGVPSRLMRPSVLRTP